jgi:hypothetical protein
MCPLIKASMLKSLYDKSVDQSLMLRQRKAFRNALKDTSTHWGDDALFRLHYGANPFGATLATAVDIDIGTNIIGANTLGCKAGQ